MRTTIAAKSAAGSTLVEIVVTVGILVSTLLPLIALLSMAMDTSGQASSNTLGARITAQLTGEAQQADWPALNAWHNRDSYFDDQGVKLTGAGRADEAAFMARTILSPAGTGITLAASNASPANPWQRQMVVLVASRPGALTAQRMDEAARALSQGKELPRHMRVSRTLLVNMQKSS